MEICQFDHRLQVGGQFAERLIDAFLLKHGVDIRLMRIGQIVDLIEFHLATLPSVLSQRLQRGPVGDAKHPGRHFRPEFEPPGI